MVFQTIPCRKKFFNSTCPYYSLMPLFIPLSSMFKLLHQVMTGAVGPGPGERCLWNNLRSSYTKVSIPPSPLRWHMPCSFYVGSEFPCDHFLSAHTSLDISLDNFIYACTNFSVSLFSYGHVLHNSFKSVWNH